MSPPARLSLRNRQPKENLIRFVVPNEKRYASWGWNTQVVPGTARSSARDSGIRPNDPPPRLIAYKTDAVAK